MKLAKVTHPECAKCKKPVEFTEQIFDAILYRHEYRMECHGERQTVELAKSWIEAGKTIEIKEAFVKPGIPIRPPIAYL